MSVVLHRARLVTALGEEVELGAWRSEGSYARVHEGAHGPARTPCAVKLPKPEIAGAAGLVGREGDLLARVTHPRVVRLRDRGAGPDGPFLVLEWLDGETLRQRLERVGRLPLRAALAVLADLGEALAAFHACAAHGDLRAENLLLVPGRGAVLIDPLVPEAGAVSPAEDLRAAAGVFHRMLTGADPDRAPRLDTGAGYNRAAVALWRRLGAGDLAAATLAVEARALEAAL